MYGIKEITTNTYHVIDRETCLFRHKPAGIFSRNTWQLHGYICYQATENAIQVHGFTNWSTVLVHLILLFWLPVAQIMTDFQADAWQQWVYAAIIAATSFGWFTQRRVCDRIGRALAQGK